MPLPVLGKILLTEKLLDSYFLLLSDWKSPQRLEKLLQQLFQVGEGSDYDKMWVRGNKCWGRVTKGSRVPTIASPPSPSAKLGLAGHGGQLSEEEVEDNRITAPPFPPLVLMMPPSAEPSRPPILVLAELGLRSISRCSRAPRPEACSPSPPSINPCWTNTQDKRQQVMEIKNTNTKNSQLSVLSLDPS